MPASSLPYVVPSRLNKTLVRLCLVVALRASAFLNKSSDFWKRLLIGLSARCIGRLLLITSVIASAAYGVRRDLDGVLRVEVLPRKTEVDMTLVRVSKATMAGLLV